MMDNVRNFSHDYSGSNVSIINVLTMREDGISKQIAMKRQHLLTVIFRGRTRRRKIANNSLYEITGNR